MKNISRARTIVLLVVFLLIVVGLLFENGWGTLSSMGIGAVAYLCPLGALETLVTGNVPVLRTLVSLVCVLVVIALIGRAFCSWVCPVPPLRHFFRPDKNKHAKKGHKDADASAKTGQEAEEGTSAGNVVAVEESDAAAQTPSATAEKSAATAEPLSAEETAALSSSCGGHTCSSCSSCGLPPVGGKRDGLQIDSRHGVLIGALASSAIFGFPVFCLVCPVGLSIAFVVGVYRAIFQQDPTISLLVFAVILLVEVVFFRKWCHKLCPIGALMSLVGSKAPFFKPRVNADKCLREQGVDCQVCVKVCPEQLDPHSGSIPECTKCGLCVEACPANAISFRNMLKARTSGGDKAPERDEALAPAMTQDRDLDETPVA